MKSWFLDEKLATNCLKTLEGIEDWKIFERNNSLMYEYYDWEQYADLREVYNQLHSQKTIKKAVFIQKNSKTEVVFFFENPL